MRPQLVILLLVAASFRQLESYILPPANRILLAKSSASDPRLSLSPRSIKLSNIRRCALFSSKPSQENLKKDDQNDARNYAEEARYLMLEAERLRLEAEREKLLLDQQKLQKKMESLAKYDAMIDSLVEKLRNRDIDGVEALMKNRLSEVDATLFLRLYDRAEGVDNELHRDLIFQLTEKIMQMVEKNDENKAKSIVKDVDDSLKSAELADSSVQQPIPTYDLIPPLNIQPENFVAMQAVGFPIRVPSSLRKFMKDAPNISKEDVDLLNQKVFGMDTFYVTGVEPDFGSVIFRGNLRGKESEAAFAKIKDRLNECPELKDKIRLFLLPDFTPPPLDDMDSVYESSQSPVVLAVSTSVAPKAPTLLTYLFSLFTLLLDSATLVLYSFEVFGLNADFMNHITKGDSEYAALLFPIIAGLFTLQLIHELAHRIAAVIVGDDVFGPPLFLPSLQIGTFGTITPFKKFPKDRKVVFDVSVAGPLVGFAASIVTLVVGLYFTAHTPLSELNTFPVVPIGFLRTSSTVGIASSLLMPSVMMQPSSVPVALHPLVTVGYAGLLINALNMLPIGRLDGGRAACSAFGRKSAALLSLLLILLQAISALFNDFVVELFWGLLVLILQRNQDIPSLDEVTDIGDQRKAVLYILFALTLFTLIPFPNINVSSF